MIVNYGIPRRGVRYHRCMKQMVWLGAAVGSTIGSYLPSLWGAGLFSFSSIILGAVGGAAGIIIAWKMTN